MWDWGVAAKKQGDATMFYQMALSPIAHHNDLSVSHLLLIWFLPHLSNSPMSIVMEGVIITALLIPDGYVARENTLNPP